jgi:hypothetical protein
VLAGKIAGRFTIERSTTRDRPAAKDGNSDAVKQDAMSTIDALSVANPIGIWNRSLGTPSRTSTEASITSRGSTLERIPANGRSKMFSFAARKAFSVYLRSRRH